MRALIPLAACSLFWVSPALCQTQSQDSWGYPENRPRPEPTWSTSGNGLGAKSAAAKISKRETRDFDGISPLERIDSRVQNRVQSRIRNRIDRWYDPQANAVSPFVVANERVRSANTSRRR